VCRGAQIEAVHGLEALPALQRVFLSNNRIVGMDSIECLLRAPAIMGAAAASDLGQV
jgi:hypothetical protein